MVSARIMFLIWVLFGPFGSADYSKGATGEITWGSGHEVWDNLEELGAQEVDMGNKGTVV